MSGRDTSARRVSECRSFGPSLEWEGLPIVGARAPHWPVSLAWLGVLAICTATAVGLGAAIWALLA